MRSLAIISRKGGAGKSTLALNLAVGAHLRGRRVLLADIDPQRSSTEALRNRRKEGPIVAPSTARKLRICLQDAELQRLEDVFIDTSAGAEEDRLEAIRLADACLLILRPAYLDIIAAAPTVELLRRLQKPTLIMINQAPRRLACSERVELIRAMDAIRLFKIPIASEIIRTRRCYQLSPQLGLSVEELGHDETVQEMARAYKAVSNFCEKVDRDRRLREAQKRVFTPPIIPLAHATYYPPWID